MKPVAVISTDWHIEEQTIGQVLDLIDQKIKLAQSLKIKTLICLGDVFESRKAQKESVLNCFTSILDKIHSAKMELWVIPGNHDKTDYSSYSSFLDPFTHHPALCLFKEPKVVSNFIFLPFISEDIWIKDLEEIKAFIDPEPLDTFSLFSHVAVNGSINNDSSRVENKITAGLLKDFKKVFLGHYHNAQQPLPNVFHLPSIKQKNFGENTEKGFTILYDDHSTEFVKSKFKEYVTLTVDANVLDAESLSKLTEESSENVNLRVEVSGTTEQIKSLNLSKLQSSGIKVKTKSSDIEQSILLAKDGSVDFENDAEIFKAFEEFCEMKGIEGRNIGIDYLKKVLDNGNN